MVFISTIIGFIFAFSAYRQSNWRHVLGILGWFTVFWGYWMLCTVLSYIVLTFLGFIARWIFIGLIILFLISFVKKRLQNSTYGK